MLKLRSWARGSLLRKACLVGEDGRCLVVFPDVFSFHTSIFHNNPTTTRHVSQQQTIIHVREPKTAVEANTNALKELDFRMKEQMPRRSGCPRAFAIPALLSSLLKQMRRCLSYQLMTNSSAMLLMKRGRKTVMEWAKMERAHRVNHPCHLSEWTGWWVAHDNSRNGRRRPAN